MDLSAQQEVTAAIVNYGNPEDTIDLISSIKDQVNSIIVVDNSNDIDPASADFKKINLITPDKNIGFGAAVNLAAIQSQTRWLLILNPDVRLQKNCLQQLLNASCQLNAPLCGPRFYWDDECTLQLPPALGHPLWLLSDRHNPNSNLSDSTDLSALAITRHCRFWKENAPFSEPVLSGACLLVDNQWFTQHKMPIFDEDFFLYYEDTDLCGRLMRKGVMPVCVADAHAVHYWNQSAEPPEGKASLMKDSEQIFIDKYYPNGPPPLPMTVKKVEFSELGKLESSPELVLPDQTAHIDIGVQDDFIVFARANLRRKAFTFNTSMWQRLRDGTYYLRAVDKAGHGLSYWHFEKHTTNKT